MTVHRRNNILNMSRDALSCGWSFGHCLLHGLGSKLRIGVPHALSGNKSPTSGTTISLSLPVN